MAGGNPLEPHRAGHPLTGPAPASAASPFAGYVFARPDLLREALRHRSAAHERGRGRSRARRAALSNERLEFIGDRVLGLLMAEWLAERFPEEQEGELGRRLARLVSQPVLAGIAEAIGLPAMLEVAAGEARAGVRQRATVLADALEASIGALYLDGGIDPARHFVRTAWDGPMVLQADPPKDAKTALQEWGQARALPLPAYTLDHREGPPHAPRFVISVSLGGQTGSGTAGTKREAEQAAAADLLRRLTA